METSRVAHEEPGVEPGRRPPLDRRERVLLMAAAAALQVIAWLVILQLFSTVLKWGYDPGITSPDVVHYADVATRVVLGRQWPYSAFPLEYPPLSILLFILPPVKGTLASYHHWFGAQMIAIDMITAVVTTAAAVRIWNGLARPLTAAVALALAVVTMGAIAVEVFDGAVALVLAVAVLCLVYRRWTLAALTIGLGFSVKLMPIVMLPLALILARTRRSVLWALLAGVAAAVGPFVPFLVHDEGGVTSSLFGAQIGRGLQIESVAASPYLVAEMIHRGAVTVTVPPGGSLTIDAAGAGLVERLAPLTVLLLLVVVYWAVWRAREELRGSPEGVPVAATAAILAA
ncbi:MAG: glycosyltransferase 87 family protein, partial [Thermoleophilia bacterium]